MAVVAQLAKLILRRLFQVGLLGFLLIAVPARAIYWRIRLLAIPRRHRIVDDGSFDVICFSHVAWSHIWQRNHHTMSRLAKYRKVIYFQTTNVAYVHRFVEEWPRSLSEYRNRHSDVKLVYPLLFPGQSRIPGIATLNGWLIATHLRWLEHTEDLHNPVLWFYYPAVANVLESYDPAAVVYDIQDEYSAFDWSPGDIAERERYLLQRADVIFGGTQTLFERKTSGFKGSAYFFPCAVEFEHFNAAAPGGNLSKLPQPYALQDLQRPRLAYAGLIDKRIDPDLLIHIATVHPEWDIVMIGPVDEKLFDREAVASAVPNVHFVGQVDYAKLPEYLAHCELYLMPWQVNDLTRHINPTKTLEYLAAARPVISISLPDLQNLFSDCVGLATTSDEFVTECEAALAGERNHKIAIGLERARGLGWNAVVEEMSQHVRTAMATRYGVTLSSHSPLPNHDTRIHGNPTYTSRNGSHWTETHKFRRLDKLRYPQRFWFIAGHIFILPIAILVLLITATCLPLYWLWDRLRSMQSNREIVDPYVSDLLLTSVYGAASSLADNAARPPAVSVIIPFYNRAAWVDGVIKSLLAQELSDGAVYEIIAVDNGSSDGTFEKLQSYPIRVIRCMERGPGAARNAGIAAASAPIVAFTDSDCIVAKNWLQSLIVPFNDPDMLLTGGCIASMTQDDFVATFTDREQILNNEKFFSASAWFPRFFATANAACRKEAILRIGGFDNSLWMSEDADMCWRLMNLGGRMAYVHDAVVYHHHRTSLGGLFYQAINYGAAATAVFAKHKTELGAHHAISWTNIKHIARSPIALLRDLARGKSTFDKTCEAYYALWRLGFTIGCIKAGIVRRVFFI